MSKQQSTTSTRRGIIAKPHGIIRLATTRQPLTMRTRHKDTHTTQPITQPKRRNCTLSTMDTRRQANEPKLKN